jgi:DNA-binding CsgD family transcriptional regulator
MWQTRDELSPRNFRRALLPVFLVLPLTVVIGDLRFLDQELALFGVDSNNLMMMIFGLGFLPVLFASERHMTPLLRAAALAQALLLMAQLFMNPGIPRLLMYCAFHAASGVGTACGFYLFAFALNNVERLLTMVVAQLYYAFTYLFRPVSEWFLICGSAAVMLALVLIAFFIKQPPQPEETPKAEPGVRESGIAAVIALNAIWYVITLMAMYIAYQDQTVAAYAYGVGGLAAVAVAFVVMLIFNYSALHLWSLCLICSVLGIGALHYAPTLAVNAGSLLYGLGEGLGFMIIFYLQGGALKRSGSFRLFQLCCLFTAANYVITSGVFLALDGYLPAAHLYLAFPVVLALAMICFLFAPVLQDRLFRADWTDGYHMADMPLYAQALAQAERLVKERIPEGLTPRETEVFTLLLTDAAPQQIASILKIRMGTLNFHSNNLYRKLNIQSRTELFANFADRTADQAD